MKTAAKETGRKLVLLTVCFIVLGLIFALRPSVAAPVQFAHTVTITQNGDGDPATTDVISAAEFTELLNSEFVNTADTLYVLQEDITIDAAALSGRYFQLKSTSLDDRGFTFYGSMEGQMQPGGGYPTITIDTAGLAPGQSARTLFGNIGSVFLYPRNMNEQYTAHQYMKNFTVEYTGNVAAAGFAQGTIHNTSMSNVHVVVNGNIVAANNYLAFSLTTPDRYLSAVGFAYNLYGHNTDGNELFENISVTANNIGSDLTTPADPNRFTYNTNGFAYNVGIGASVQDIRVSYQSMSLRSYGNPSSFGESNSINGFSSYLYSRSAGTDEDPVADRLQVSVAGDMHVMIEGTNGRGLGGTGVYGISSDMVVLTNSSVTVGGNMICETLDGTKPASATSDNATVTVFGTIFYTHRSGDTAPQIANNTASINGSLIARSHGTTRILLGAGAISSSAQYTYSSENNTVTVGGDLISERIGWALDNDAASFSNIYGMAYALKSSSNDRLTVGGNVSARQDGGGSASQVTFTGLSYFTNTLVNNKAVYRGNITLSAPRLALASGGAYIQQNAPAQNNAVHILGNVDLNAGEAAEFSGFALLIGGAQVSDNIVRVDGAVTVTGGGTAEGDGGYASGFVNYAESGASLSGNAVFIKDGIAATTAAGAFALQAYPGSVLSSNTVIGKPGVPELYSRYVYEVISGANVEGNFYTSALDGQRASNLLAYNAETDVFSLASDTPQERLVVSNTTNFSEGAAYVLESGLATQLTGTDVACVGNSRGNLTAPHPASLMLTHAQDGLVVAKDLPGIGHPYAGNVVAGTIYQDYDNNGSKSAPFAGVTIDLMLGDTVVGSAVTDSQGAYSIPVPLHSAAPLTFKIVLQVPSGSTLGASAANAFGSTGEITAELGYASNYTYEGYLVVPAPLATLTFSKNTNDANSTEASPSTQTVPLGSTLAASGGALPGTPPTRPGYTFQGWATTQGATEPNFTLTTPVSGDMTVYAVWAEVEQANYRVEHYLVRNNDTVILLADALNYAAEPGTAVTATTRPYAGYEYAAGYTNGNLAEIASGTVSSDGVLVLRLFYRIQSFAVSFVDWNGTPLSTQTVEYGAHAVAPANPTRNGHSFIGWSTGFSSVTGPLTVTALYQANPTPPPAIVTPPTTPVTPPVVTPPAITPPETGEPQKPVTPPTGPTLSEATESEEESAPANESASSSSESSNGTATYDKDATPSEVLQILKEEHNVPTITLGGIELPLAAGPLSHLVWALANLLLALTGSALALITALRVLLAKRREKQQVAPELAGTAYEQEHKRTLLRDAGTIAVAALGVIGVALFILTEDMTRLMVLTDSWTIANAVLLVAEIVGIFFVLRDTRAPKPANLAGPESPEVQ